MEIKMIMTFGISLVATLCIMPFLIPYLHKIKFGQVEREEGLASHKKKGGTPTMGGIVFVLVPILVCALLDYKMFTDLRILVVILAYLGYALIGFIDDFIIVVKKNNEGLKPKVKFFMQSVLAVVFYLIYSSFVETTLWIPLLNCHIELGILYFFFVFIMFTAESNAVNLTDGLDGLCAGTCIIALAPFLLFSLMDQSDELGVLLCAVIGALFGYLKFNLHPAKIFMGDTGSLALGGLLAAVAMVEKRELLLLVIGGLFLAETLSVIIQVAYFKRTGKRIFKMAPLHHHFELCGMSETKVVMMFYCIGFFLALLGILLGVM